MVSRKKTRRRKKVTAKKTASASSPSILKEAQLAEKDATKAVAKSKTLLDRGTLKMSRAIDAARRKKRALSKRRISTNAAAQRLTARLKKKSTASTRRELKRTVEAKSALAAEVAAVEKELNTLREQYAEMKLMKAESDAVGKAALKARKAFKKKVAKSARRRR